MKNSFRIAALVIIIWFLTLACSCHKEQYVGIDTTLKADFEYGPGSYWLYRDTATGRIDSLYFYSKATYQLSSRQDGNSYEHMVQDMYMVHNDGGNPDTVSKWLLRLEEQRLWYQYIPKTFFDSSLSHHKYSEYGFSYPFAKGTIYFPECKVDVLPSYTVLGTTYTNVARLYALALKDEDYVHITREEGMISIAQKHEGFETVTRTYELVKAVIVR